MGTLGGPWVGGGPPHVFLYTGELNLGAEIKLVIMGTLLVDHAERMIDFGNSLESGLPFLTRWASLGNHDTEQGCSRVSWETPKVLHSPSGIFFLVVG